MGQGLALVTLQSRGDVVEQHASAVEAISKAVCRYAALWANYVLPARLPDNPAFVGGRFKDLAELSYSALVRLASAAEAQARVEAACELMLESDDNLGVGVLRAQEALFAFFCNAGAAVDLLNKGASAAGGSNVVMFEAPDDQWGSGNWFYKRRNGYIHERITPVFAVSGLLHLDVEALKQKDPSWETSPKSPRELSELVRELLGLLNDAMATGWARLHQHLRKIAPPGVAAVGSHVTISSASPR